MGILQRRVGVSEEFIDEHIGERWKLLAAGVDLPEGKNT
jgi:hypothetical protein